MKKVILAFLFLVIAVGANAIINHDSKNVFNIFTKAPRTPTATIDGTTFNLLIAKTEAEREQGLSGRDSLAQNEGMIFLFDNADYYSFWMKDMKFSLDMIFINNNKIVDIFQNISIQNPLNKETPKQKANEVLEINAGLAKKYNFKIGDSVNTSL